MRASRLLSLLMLLQSRGRMTASELASELEVSVRTIYRDLEALSAAGVPVYAEPGRYGGCQLVDGWRTRLTGLTTDEAESLFLAGAPAAASELGLGTVLAAAQLKVLAALPPELRGRAVRVRQRFHLDAPGWFKRDEEVPHLASVAEAVWGDRRVELRYRRAGSGSERSEGGGGVAAERVDRLVDPLGLVLKAGTWYLVARHRNTIRTYRVSRIEAATVLDERFDRPDDFELAAHWSESSNAFERSLVTVDVRVRVRADAVPQLRYLDPKAAERALESVGEPGTDGWVDATVPSESLEIAYWELLRFGDSIEVLEPVELRERLATTAAAMADLYDGRTAVDSVSRAASSR
ncbi:MAG: helix-turn-helix transcriptional regulator [Acidimicrobiales bacterium]